MASPSESRNITSEEAEVTSEHRNPEMNRRQLLARPEDGVQAAGSAAAVREFDLEFPLVRQTSIYSLTLDEIQNAVCEPGKTFGSMNMDEFLTNIWNVEEVQATAAAANDAPANNLPDGAEGAMVQPLRRRGSLALPAPLSRKTVDEVWAEIHRDASLRSQQVERVHQDDGARTAPRQPTFGEMTLEDFLIKAGVVGDGYGGGAPVVPSPHPQPVAPPPPVAVQQYGMAGFGHVVGMAGYVDQQGLGAACNGGYPVGNGFGGRIANGYGTAAAAGSPASPVSSEGIGGGQVDNSVAGYIADGNRSRGGVGGGRKRTAEGGSVDKVVERRQRRMIKNRESAARSRARKQAYTVELEAELNLLKEENFRLREEQTRVMSLRKQMVNLRNPDFVLSSSYSIVLRVVTISSIYVVAQLLEMMTEQARINMQKAAKKLRRSNSNTW